MIQHILFDLDDTLYPSSVGLMNEISERINQYLLTRMGVPAAEVTQVRQSYWERYGTTLRGLYLEKHIDPQEYLDFVHRVRVEEHLRPDRQLDAMLSRLTQKKYVFTNSPESHARRVLAALGVEKHFCTVFDINFIQYESKPAPTAYTRVLAALAARPDECLMIDDSARNLAPAKALGIRTVLLDGSATTGRREDVDEIIKTIYEVSKIML